MLKQRFGNRSQPIMTKLIKYHPETYEKFQGLRQGRAMGSGLHALIKIIAYML